jgi:hypothetical protein
MDCLNAKANLKYLVIRRPVFTIGHALSGKVGKL